MGSRATAFLPRSGRSTLAGAGAAGSLLAAIAAAALIAPGLISFDDWSLAPRAGPGGNLRVDPGAAVAGLAGGPAASATSAPVALPAARERAADGRGSSDRGRDRDRVGAGPGSGSALTRPAAPGAATPPRRGPVDGPAGVKESLARDAEGAGTAVGGDFELLGATAGDAFSRLSPGLGSAARRAGAVSGEGARRSGKAVGDAVRRLPGAAPAPKAPPLADRVLR